MYVLQCVYICIKNPNWFYAYMHAYGTAKQKAPCLLLLLTQQAMLAAGSVCWKRASGLLLLLLNFSCIWLVCFSFLYIFSYRRHHRSYWQITKLFFLTQANVSFWFLICFLCMFCLLCTQKLPLHPLFFSFLNETRIDLPFKMPLLKRKAYTGLTTKPPEDLQPQELVFQVRFTKEIFRDYM